MPLSLRPSSAPFQAIASAFPPEGLGGSEGKESACNAGDQVQSLDQGDLLEKETATHSSILACEIPWTEEPGGLQSKGW